MKQSDLKHVYSPVPQGFHNALHNAAHSVRQEEEKPMKKMSTIVLVCILILALACGTALAIVNYYSVRQYEAGDQPSEIFEKYITELHQTFENDYITFTLTDAIFDGDGIALAMNIASKDINKPVYLYPKLTATCSGKPLALDIQGMRGDFTSGFMIPMQTDEDERNGQYGFDASIYEDEADGDVSWTFTMQVLAPNWPIRNDDALLRGEEPGLEFSEFLQRFSDAYAGQEILTTWGESLVEYATMLPIPDGMAEEEFRQMQVGEQLAQSDAFTLVDMIVCEFDTVLPLEHWKNVSAGLTFPMNEYTVEFTGFNLSFMRAAYSFDLVLPSAATLESAMEMAENGFDYVLIDQNGKELDAGGFSSKKALVRDDGKVVLRLDGGVNFNQVVPTEISFSLVMGDDAHQFTVPITNNLENVQSK